MTHYQALELLDTATSTDIRQAYRRLVLLTHPDRTTEPAAHARYLLVNAAYEVLSDPSRRAAYNWQLRTPPPSPSPAVTPGRARDAFRRSAAQPASKSAPNNATSYYQNVYVHYADIGRLACCALLVFSILIGMDRMWVLDYPHETVLSSNFYNPAKSAPYCVVETPHASARGQCFYVGEVLAVRRTAVFRQVLSCHIVATTSGEAPTEYEMGENIYVGPGLLLLLTMFLTAAAGAWPGSGSATWGRRTAPLPSS